MAQFLQTPSPMMGARAGFHADQTTWPPFEECKKLAPAELTPCDNLALVVKAMDLDDIFGEINADCAELQHGWLLILDAETPSWRIATPGAGANHTINRNGLFKAQGADQKGGSPNI
jgi:hypothetical protein